MNPGEFVETKICKECGDEVETVDSTFGLCWSCKTRRDRAYDDYVDPLHWYHQHDPDRVCEPFEAGRRYERDRGCAYVSDKPWTRQS